MNDARLNKVLITPQNWAISEKIRASDTRTNMEYQRCTKTKWWRLHRLTRWSKASHPRQEMDVQWAACIGREARKQHVWGPRIQKAGTAQTWRWSSQQPATQRRPPNTQPPIGQLDGAKQKTIRTISKRWMQKSRSSDFEAIPLFQKFVEHSALFDSQSSKVCSTLSLHCIAIAPWNCSRCSPWVSTSSNQRIPIRTSSYPLRVKNVMAARMSNTTDIAMVRQSSDIQIP